MNEDMVMIRPVARIHSDFDEKFGIPRQPRLVEDLRAAVVLEDVFNDPDAVRGIEEYSHLWLIWGFSKNRNDMSAEHPKWNPTVRPPRLGGQVKKGVFATRSPYRPNSLGMSAVKLVEVRGTGEEGSKPGIKGKVTLIVEGADLLDGTPIYDIKPYIPYSDTIEGASGGFSCSDEKSIEVEFPEELLSRIPEEKRTSLMGVLGQDPRGAYEKAPGYLYGMKFAGFDIRFVCEGDRLIVRDVIRPEETGKTAKIK